MYASCWFYVIGVINCRALLQEVNLSWSLILKPNRIWFQCIWSVAISFLSCFCPGSVGLRACSEGNYLICSVFLQLDHKLFLQFNHKIHLQPTALETLHALEKAQDLHKTFSPLMKKQCTNIPWELSWVFYLTGSFKILTLGLLFGECQPISMLSVLGRCVWCLL